MNIEGIRLSILINKTKEGTIIFADVLHICETQVFRSLLTESILMVEYY